MSLKNPHDIVKGDIGLGNVDNTSDADKPISSATSTALDNKRDVGDGDVVSPWTATIDNAVVLPTLPFGFGPATPVLTPVANGVEISADGFGVGANDQTLFTPTVDEVGIYFKITSLPVFDNTPGNEAANGWGFLLTNSIPPTQYNIVAALMRDDVDQWYFRDPFMDPYGSGAGPYTDAQILNQNCSITAYLTNGGLDLNFTLRVGGTAAVPAIIATRTWPNYVGTISSVPVVNAITAMLAVFQTGPDTLTADWLEFPLVDYTAVTQFTGFPVIDEGVLPTDGFYRLDTGGHPEVQSSLGSLPDGEFVGVFNSTLLTRGVNSDVFDPSQDTNFGGDNNYTGEQFFAGDLLFGGKVVDKVNLSVAGTENLGTLNQYTSYVVECNSASAAATGTLPDRDAEGGGDNLVYVHVTFVGYEGGTLTLASGGPNFWEKGTDTGSNNIVLNNGDDILFVTGPTSSGDPYWHIINRSTAGVSIDDNAGDGATGVAWSADKIFDELALKEDNLGNPITSGDMLVSTDAGVRSWQTPVTIDDNQGDGATGVAWSADKVFDELTLRDTDINGKEDDLGNPTINGQYLTSTTGGVRSWNSLPPGADITTQFDDPNLTSNIIVGLPNTRHVVTTGSNISAVMLLPTISQIPTMQVGDKIIYHPRFSEGVNTINAQSGGGILEFGHPAGNPPQSISAVSIQYAEFTYAGSNEWDVWMI